MKITFGKYKDKQINWIKKNDINYYNWLLNNIADFKERFNKKKPAKIPIEYTVVNNDKWNDEFKFHESYPKDINEKLLEWYRTPYYKIKNK